MADRLTISTITGKQPLLALVNSETLIGTRNALSFVVAGIPRAIVTGLLVTLLLAVLRALFRSARIPLVVFVIWTSVVISVRGGQPSITWFFAALGTTVVAALVVRNGLLALIVYLFVYHYLLQFPLTANLQAWYSESGLFSLWFIALLAAGGAWIAVYARPNYHRAG